MDHYFTNNKIRSDLKKVIVKIEDKSFNFYTDLGVFSKRGLDFGSRCLINTLLKENIFGDVLDLGCGYGVVGIILSSFFSIKADMVDVNKRAVHLTKMNIKENKKDDLVAFESDIYSNINNKYNFIITNPPIKAGKKVVYEMLFKAKDYLKDNGTLYFVMNKNQGALSAIKDLKEKAQIEVLSKNKGFYVIKCIF